MHVEHESGASKKLITVSIPTRSSPGVGQYLTVSQEAELEATGCDQAVTIDCLRDLYHFDYTPLAADKNTIGVGTCLSNAMTSIN